MSDTQAPTPQAGDAPETTGDKSLDKLLAEAQARFEEQRDAWVRAVAETENVRKRAQADIAAAHKYGNERFAENLLPVVDSLEAALVAAAEAPQPIRDGLEITLKQLKTAFQRSNLVEVIPAKGERFDPHRHQAVAAVEAQQDPNTVVEVMQKGYRLYERTLRPALVTVAKAVENKEVAPTSEGNGTSDKDPS